MEKRVEMNQDFSRVRRKMLINLGVSWIIPMILVFLFRTFTSSDTAALAIAGAIPAVKTIVLLIWRRRIDWIGISGTLGFAVTLAVSALSGGSSLPLKLYHPVVTGTIGLIFLISAIIRKPALLVIIRLFRRGRAEGQPSPANSKKLIIFTALLGIVFLVDAVIHIVMALTLSTVTFLTASKAVTWAAILIIIIGRRWIVGGYKKNQQVET